MVNRQVIIDNIIGEILKKVVTGKVKISDMECSFDDIFSTCFPKGFDEDEETKIIKTIIGEIILDYDSPLLRTIDKACTSCSKDTSCAEHCPVGALDVDPLGAHNINSELCISCGLCVLACKSYGIIEKSDILKTLKLMEYNNPCYAILAPSFVGQFGPLATPEKIKLVLKSLGFTDIFEVALGADVITLDEAQEFCERMEKDQKFMITSCCCPAFIKLVEKHKPKVAHLVSKSVSPMIALGRALKVQEKCSVVFIGPCMAKKSEARLDNFKGIIDCVLTYKELNLIFKAMGIDWEGINDAPLFIEASHDGRIFAHTGGVTEAITKAVKDINPSHNIIPLKGNGLKQCSEILENIEVNKSQGNFMEGMACPGG